MAALSTNILLALTGANTLNQFSAQRQQANAVSAQGAYQWRLAEWNANLAEQAAKDAIARGDIEAGRVRSATRQTVGSQRAALAAQGIDINTGSAADVQSDTTRIGALDELTTKNNAAREAFGYTVQAWNERQQGELARLGSRNAADALRRQSWGTVLTGATQAYGVYRAGK